MTVVTAGLGLAMPLELPPVPASTPVVAAVCTALVGLAAAVPWPRRPVLVLSSAVLPAAAIVAGYVSLSWIGRDGVGPVGDALLTMAGMLLLVVALAAAAVTQTVALAVSDESAVPPVVSHQPHEAQAVPGDATSGEATSREGASGEAVSGVAVSGGPAVGGASDGGGGSEITGRDSAAREVRPRWWVAIALMLGSAVVLGGPPAVDVTGVPHLSLARPAGAGRVLGVLLPTGQQPLIFRTDEVLDCQDFGCRRARHLPVTAPASTAAGWDDGSFLLGGVRVGGDGRHVVDPTRCARGGGCAHHELPWHTRTS